MLSSKFHHKAKKFALEKLGVCKIAYFYLLNKWEILVYKIAQQDHIKLPESFFNNAAELEKATRLKTMQFCKVNIAVKRFLFFCLQLFPDIFLELT